MQAEQFAEAVGRAGLSHLIDAGDIRWAYRVIGYHFGLDLPQGRELEYTDQLCRLMETQVAHGPDSP